MRPGEGENQTIGRDELRAFEKALRAAGDVRSVLDLGTGNGRWWKTLAAAKPGLFVGLDISRETLAKARAAGSSLTGLVCADAGALPFPAQSFDVVVCLQLMPYVRRSGRLRALREMRRVTARWVIVEYAHIEGLSFFWQRFRRGIGLEANFPRNHLSGADIEAELRRAGLGMCGYVRVGGRFSRSWVVLAEAPSPEWMMA